MGNTTSSNNIDINNTEYLSGGGQTTEIIDAQDKLDFTAAHYILTMDFDTLHKLYKQEYCNELVGTITDILERYFTESELIEIHKKLQDDVSTKKTKVERKQTEKNVCLEISKFYVKIAHIYAVILTTINPEYVYTDKKGDTVKRRLHDKDKIPKYAKVNYIRSGICDSRIQSLKGESIIPDNLEGSSGADITIQPDICKTDLYSAYDSGVLTSVPGIPELIHLYNDSGYDLKTGVFSDMKPETKERYSDDLKRFYTVFTQQSSMPDSIKNFDDIKLRDYGKDIYDTCNKEPIKGTPDNDLLLKYALNLKEMIQYTNTQQDEILTMLHKLFEFVKMENGNENIRVSSKLNNNILQSIIEECRVLIVEMYIHCEEDYKKGIHLYEAIVESSIIKTTQSQLVSLEEEKDKLIR
jgi:hypothetical protein